MNIDELINTIDEAELRENLGLWISEWKKDESDISQLCARIAKWHANVWLEDQAKQHAFLAMLQVFKERAVEGVGGMTVNERLYWYGLFEQWDDSDEVGRQRIRAKLHAPA